MKKTQKNKKKSSPRKKQQQIQPIQEYISKTRKEIDTKVSEIINKAGIKDIDANALSLDDNIQPVLTVISGDVSGNSHDISVSNAATLKSITLGLSAMQSGMYGIPQLDIFTITSFISSGIPCAAGIASSVLECVSRNLTKGEETNIFQYGLACHLGASGTQYAGQLYDIGILIGKIDYKISIDSNYEKVQELINQLPDNKYRTLFLEIIKSRYNEAKGILIKTQISKQSESVSDSTTIHLKPRRKKLSVQPIQPVISKQIIEQHEQEQEKLFSDVIETTIEEKPIRFSTAEDEK